MSGPPSMRTRSSAPDAVDRALCRSALWEALAVGLGPPTDETVVRLASGDGAAALGEAAAALDRAEGADLQPLVAALAVEPAPTLAALEGAYGRLFGHTVRGPVTPYETEYGEDSVWQPQREMSDLGAFFRAFGLRVRPDARERPDHIACECEFLLVLARKEAHALARGDEAMREETCRAARSFLRDHLGRWAPALGARLAREDPDGFYGALGRLTAAFVATECRRVRVAAGPELLRLRSAAPDPAPTACVPAAGASVE
ncbi:MAG: molecular chaperone TorD family protein [Candidatus Rokubacteria bacterium]|nr:molecular chaperone TorD family protein [Candidatus Rokubacteria bacterium]